MSKNDYNSNSAKFWGISGYSSPLGNLHLFDMLQWMLGLFIIISLVILGFVLRMQWQMQNLLFPYFFHFVGGKDTGETRFISPFISP